MKKVFGAIWRYIKQTDMMLILITLVAALYGLLLVYSAMKSTGGSRTVLTQLIAIILGLVSMVILSKIDYADMIHLWKFVAAVGVILLLLPFVLPHTRAGSQDLSWVNLKFITIQPAEFVKVFFVITFAKHYEMVKENINSPLNVLLLTLHAGVPIGIIVVQKDMGMALVFICMFVSMMFAANVQLRYFALGSIALLASSPLIWLKIFSDTQRNRILVLFDPTKYAGSTALQQLSARSAIGSGELWGYGIFNGPRTQSTASSMLPERQNDMIFAVAGEEFGFIGCILILLIFITLLILIISKVRTSKDSLGAMICVGIFSSFAVQMVINIGMVLMLLPVIGISLPLFSSGGSSVLSSFFAVGVVLSVHMHRKKPLFSGQWKD
jgi:rod shape determining protein RodA